MIKKIISGAQTGVDRAALDVARKLNIAHGGWCPKGRKAEDGIIPTYYHLQETDTEEYAKRTKLNIQDSDGTLILVAQNLEQLTDGTRLTIEQVKTRKKPHLIINLSQEKNVDSILKWINENTIEVLNIAGPRESKVPGIYQLSFNFLLNCFR